MVIKVDHKLRIALSELPPDLQKHIVEALTIPNQARQRMIDQGIYGWQRLPEKIKLYEYDPKAAFLNAPRGFAWDLISKLQEFDHRIEMTDNRRFKSGLKFGMPILLRPWQEKAVDAVLLAQEGIYKAPAGSGKTVAMLEVIRRVGGKAIVLVNTKDILWQWRDRAQQFGFDCPIGQIGDDKFQVSDFLTIATVQTLDSRFAQIEAAGFFDEFTTMILDECHHATADTYNRIVNRFSSRYRIGVSATPDKTGDFKLATLVLGPIIAETEPSDVTTLIKPEVIKITTKFRFPYRGARGGRPSNYSSLISHLISDIDRNKLIAEAIWLDEGTHSLVISKRLEHLAELERLILERGYQNPIYKLTGKESSDERQGVVVAASKHPCVIFSTLADEALDIPRLDRIFLTFPQRNPGLITQQVGRVERQSDGKTNAIIYDFCDLGVGPLEAQWKKRRFEVYEPRGYKITQIKCEEIV